MPVLFCLILVRTLTGASVHHDVRRDGVECHDWQMTSAHGTSDGQGHDVELSLLTWIGGTRMKEKKDPAILEAVLSLVLLLFLRYNTRFPLAYKRKSRVPHEGDPDPHKIEPRDKNTRT